MDYQDGFEDGVKFARDVIVNNINAKVKEDDILIHLGDWSFGGINVIGEFREKINCKNIHLVHGNHDHHIKRNKEDVKKYFTTSRDYLFLTVVEQINHHTHTKTRLVCMHYPIASWDGMNDGVIHLHGHVHFNPAIRIGPGKMMDVGVDGNNLEPISLKEIIDLMEKQPIKSMLSFDHHLKEIQ